VIANIQRTESQRRRTRLMTQLAQMFKAESKADILKGLDEMIDHLRAKPESFNGTAMEMSGKNLDGYMAWLKRIRHEVIQA